MQIRRWREWNRIGRGEAGRIELGVVGTALWEECVLRCVTFESKSQCCIAFREKSLGMQMVVRACRELDAGIWRMAIRPAVGFTQHTFA